MSTPAEVHVRSALEHPYDHDGDSSAALTIPAFWAEIAARAVLSDLRDRRGIGHALDDPEIDLETRREIVESLSQIIRTVAVKYSHGDDP